MRPERFEKIERVARQRQLNLSVLLENVHDPHNVSAVLRTCDAMGIAEIYVLLTDPRLQNKRFKMGKRTSGGSRKWVDVHVYYDLEACVSHLKHRYHRLLATHLQEGSYSLYELNLAESAVIVFGNERAGVSAKLLEACDGSLFVPQVGMVQSLNVSVACAIVLYEAFRQRLSEDLYQNNRTASKQVLEELLANYLSRK